MRGAGIAFTIACACVACGGLEGEGDASDARAPSPDVFDSSVVVDEGTPFDGAIDAFVEVAPIDALPLDSGVDAVDVAPPPDVGPLEPLQLSLGDMHSCALRADGAVLCWGLPAFFGDSTTAGAVTTPETIAAFTGVKKIVAGIDHTCAVMTDGTAQCVGYAIGGPSAPHGVFETPTPIAGLDGVADLVVGGMSTCTYACALRTDGTVACWGCNSHGTLGDGTLVDRATPTLVPGLTGVVGISAHPQSDHTCVRLGDGTARCWGENNLGQIGDGTTLQRTSPTPVIALDSLADVAADNEFSFGRRVDGTLWGWGTSFVGELATGSFDSQPIPGAVPGLVAEKIDLGMYHACALLKDASLACWGRNDSGQIGNGTTLEQDTPAVIYTKNVVDVALGSFHTCVRLGDGSLWCWGSNYWGELGAGLAAGDKPHALPVRVVGF